MDPHLVPRKKSKSKPTKKKKLNDKRVKIKTLEIHYFPCFLGIQTETVDIGEETMLTESLTIAEAHDPLPSNRERSGKGLG